MSKASVTVITPTTGRPSLQRLISSIDAQTIGGNVLHLLLWDNVRDPAAPPVRSFEAPHRLNLVLSSGFGRNGNAPGSPLRAVGLMAADTPWVTFADDDVYWEADHLAALESADQGVNWASTLRTVWSPSGLRLGVDRFESVGDDPARKVPYEMCDNNCLIFRRELGAMAASLYRETRDYNDDRLMYGFLKTQAGPRGKTGRPTINQICPDRLINFFSSNCSLE